MNVKVIKTCDEAMTDSDVVDFVTNVFKAAERVDTARPSSERSKARLPVGDTWIELSVGKYIGGCRAELIDKDGVLGVFNNRTHLFHPEGGLAPYILE
ncbi:MAG: hypothetical protein PUF10_03005 [Bacteroidales bacterium]|nr:hypothetical protein [Bacteroidales bacterium]